VCDETPVIPGFIFCDIRYHPVVVFGTFFGDYAARYLFIAYAIF
jgi:hypothetical protein